MGHPAWHFCAQYDYHLLRTRSQAGITLTQNFTIQFKHTRTHCTTATPCCMVCPTSLIRKLQSVQNAAAHLITGARWCCHITPVLWQLHWLLARQRVDYKVAYLVHQSLSGHAPRYLANNINLVANSGRCLLQSAYDRTCAVPRTYTSSSDKIFSISGNVLLPCLQQDISYGQFKRQLKTFLFRSYTATAHSDCRFLCLRNSLTYIHQSNGQLPEELGLAS